MYRTFCHTRRQQTLKKNSEKEAEETPEKEAKVTQAIRKGYLRIITDGGNKAENRYVFATWHAVVFFWLINTYFAAIRNKGSVFKLMAQQLKKVLGQQKQYLKSYDGDINKKCLYHVDMAARMNKFNNMTQYRLVSTPPDEVEDSDVFTVLGESGAKHAFWSTKFGIRKDAKTPAYKVQNQLSDAKINADLYINLMNKDESCNKVLNMAKSFFKKEFKTLGKNKTP